MKDASLGQLAGPFDSCAALRDSWDGHRQVTANRDFSEKRFDRTDF
jgi:hypothetical protein